MRETYDKVVSSFIAWHLILLESQLYRDPESIEWLKGSSFLDVVWFGSSSTPYLPPSSISKLSPFLSLPVCRRWSLLTGEGVGEGGVGGAKSYDGWRRERMVLC